MLWCGAKGGSQLSVGTVVDGVLAPELLQTETLGTKLVRIESLAIMTIKDVGITCDQGLVTLFG